MWEAKSQKDGLKREQIRFQKAPKRMIFFSQENRLRAATKYNKLRNPLSESTV